MSDINFLLRNLKLLHDPLKMAPAQLVKVEGYEEFKKALKLYEKSDVFIHFVGNRNEKGVSWCTDCNEAEPYIVKGLQNYAPETAVFIEVQVGQQSEFKDMKNQFRTDTQIHLTQVPTLLHWKTQARLEGSYYCGKLDLLELFFKYEEN